MKATKTLVDRLMREFGLGEGDDELLLDELVIDLKDKEASSINNEGSRSQLTYIIESAGSVAEVQEMVRSAIHDPPA